MARKKEEVVEVQDELVPQDAPTETPTEEVVKVVEEKTEPQVVTLAQKNKCRQ
jgi:hypothetical protein